MKYVKLFEEFTSVDEAAIQVYGPGNPWKKLGKGMTWTGVETWIPKYAEGGRHIIIGADFDFDQYIADKSFRSKPMGTWNEKTLPKFKDKNPKYDEVEFDFVEFVKNEEKPREPWVKIADKNGVEFMIPPFMILDIVQGGSVRDKIEPGSAYMIDNMRGTIADYKGDTIYIKLQNGEEKQFKLPEWRSKNFTSLDENENAL